MNPGPQSDYSIIFPSAQNASDFLSAVRRIDHDQRLWLDPVTQDCRRIKFEKDQSLEHVNATGRCSRLYDPTTEAFKQAGKWSGEMVPGPGPGVLVREVRLLSVDRKLWAVVDSVPKVPFYAEVLDKSSIAVFYDKETAAHFGIEDFAKSKAPCYSGWA